MSMDDELGEHVRSVYAPQLKASYNVGNIACTVPIQKMGVKQKCCRSNKILCVGGG